MDQGVQMMGLSWNFIYGMVHLDLLISHLIHDWWGLTDCLAQSPIWHPCARECARTQTSSMNDGAPGGPHRFPCMISMRTCAHSLMHAWTHTHTQPHPWLMGIRGCPAWSPMQDTYTNAHAHLHKHARTHAHVHMRSAPRWMPCITPMHRHLCRATTYDPSDPSHSTTGLGFSFTPDWNPKMMMHFKTIKPLRPWII